MMLTKKDFKRGLVLKIIDNTHFDSHYYETGNKVKVVESVRDNIFHEEEDRVRVERLSDRFRQWVAFSDVAFIDNSVRKIG